MDKFLVLSFEKGTITDGDLAEIKRMLELLGVVLVSVPFTMENNIAPKWRLEVTPKE